MAAFTRKITAMIEELKTVNEGRENPRTVAILEKMDQELQKLSKSTKASAK